MLRPLLSILLFLPLAAGSTEISPARATELEHLLRHDCGSCHGMRLTGGLGPALTSTALGEKSAVSLQQAILAGRPGTAMPPWGGILTSGEVQWLVDALREGRFDD